MSCQTENDALQLELEALVTGNGSYGCPGVLGIPDSKCSNVLSM